MMYLVTCQSLGAWGWSLSLPHGLKRWETFEEGESNSDAGVKVASGGSSANCESHIDAQSIRESNLKQSWNDLGVSTPACRAALLCWC